MKIKFLTIIAAVALVFTACNGNGGNPDGPKESPLTVIQLVDGEEVELKATQEITVTETDFEIGHMKFDGMIINNTTDDQTVVMRANRQNHTEYGEDACVGSTCLPSDGSATQDFEGEIDAEGNIVFYCHMAPNDMTKAAQYKVTYEFFIKGQESEKITAAVTYDFVPNDEK